MSGELGRVSVKINISTEARRVTRHVWPRRLGKECKGKVEKRSIFQVKGRH